MYKTPSTCLLESLLLEVVSNNISWGMGVVSFQHPGELFLQLLLGEVQLISWFDKLPGPEIITINVIIVSISKAIFILHVHCTHALMFKLSTSRDMLVKSW